MRIEDFDGTEDWETAVITYCIINAFSMKNALFNQNVRKQKSRKGEHSIRPKRDEFRLKRAK